MQVGAVLLAFLLVPNLLVLNGCGLRDAREPAPPIEQPPIRPVRVRLNSDVPAVRLRSEGPILLLNATGDEVIATVNSAEWTLLAPGPGGTIAFGSNAGVAGALLARGQDDRHVQVCTRRDENWSLPKTYAGELLLRVSAAGGLMVVNLVDIETYVGCVVAGEIGANFAVEAYRAQAVASRGYALYAMLEAQDSGAPYDVTAGEGSQVYEGLRDDAVARRARDAAAYTRGIVCTWLDGDRERLFPTYYSSVCGGVSQSGRIFGPASDVPPLAGGAVCGYCSIAPKGTYRWGPVTMSLLDAQARLVARDARVGDIGPLTDIEVIERAAGERPSRIRLVGTGGRTHDLSAENFRLALGGRQLKSTHFDLTVKGSTLVFENGRGFGHGLGLCQWGMEGQAREGRRAEAILAHYYPDMRLTRAY